MKNITKLFTGIFKRKTKLTEEQISYIKEDTSIEIEKVVEKIKEDLDKKNQKIHNLLVDIMLLENDII